jgi:hypothetical protein
MAEMVPFLTAKEILNDNEKQPVFRPGFSPL